MSGLPIISIDPGHNVSSDIGASYQHYSEDKIVLAVAKKLADLCQNVGIKTVDCLPKSAISVSDSLQQRCDKSNSSGATIYVSIHCNAATPTNGARGCETYAKSTAGKAVAANINRELNKLGFKNRGVKETLDGRSVPFVIRNTSAIAVLVEICFLDAAEDMAVFNQKGIAAIALAIYNGLTHGMDFDPKPNDFDNDPVAAPVKSLLVDAAKWYKGMLHQEAAFRALESDLTATQLANFKAAYSPVIAIPSSISSTPNLIPMPGKFRTVADWIVNGDGSTSGVDGLSDQIILMMGDTGLVKFTHSRFIAADNCDPYFCTEVVNKLKQALDDNPTLIMQCNSGYRSPVRQLVLRQFYERGINGIAAAARVGTGNHERGTAIDLENWEQWKTILISDNWHWQGANDRWHFDVNISSKIPNLAIAAYQRLANKHGNSLSEDGIWGSNTEQSMLQAPASGWQ